MNNIKLPYVYTLASQFNGTIYIGVTGDLVKRVYQHRNNLVDRFTKSHSVHKLVWFEQYETMEDAIVYEKKVKN